MAVVPVLFCGGGNRALVTRPVQFYDFMVSHCALLSFCVKAFHLYRQQKSPFIAWTGKLFFKLIISCGSGDFYRSESASLKKQLAAYAAAYPGECSQIDADPDTGCMEFEIRKGRFSFRLTAPYSEERRRAASEAAKKHSGNLTRTIQKDVV